MRNKSEKVRWLVRCGHAAIGLGYLVPWKRCNGRSGTFKSARLYVARATLCARGKVPACVINGKTKGDDEMRNILATPIAVGLFALAACQSEQADQVED